MINLSFSKDPYKAQRLEHAKLAKQSGNERDSVLCVFITFFYSFKVGHF
jgi:hypothetical protein